MQPYQQDESMTKAQEAAKLFAFYVQFKNPS